jgi:hypothetical protein
MADLGYSVITSQRVPRFSRAYMLGLLLCVAGGALGDDSLAPAGGFLSSLRQAFNHDFDHDVVRGHFDVGTPPDTHRYYCLVDAKTGKREANGVGGQPVLRPDGMTTIKSGAVSFYSCDNAERQGNLITAGYPLIPGADAAIPRTVAAPAQPTQAPTGTASPSPSGIDVAGVRLGMTPDQVRTLLKSKNLLDYHESAQALSASGSPGGAARSTGDSRFVNVIAAWTAPSTASAEDGQGGESYEVMFTPVPGRERVMAIVHSATYAAAHDVRESVVEHALVTKYGGYSQTEELPSSPTWRFQSSGNVLSGDACSRRGILGGLSELNVGAPARQNIALTTTTEEFRYQIDRCGVAIVTEDHSTLNGDAPRQERLIARFTVTAYSPSIGFDGAAAAMQLIQAAGNTVGKGQASRAQPAPNL